MPPPTPVWHPCRDAPAILTVGSGVVEGTFSSMKAKGGLGKGTCQALSLAANTIAATAAAVAHNIREAISNGVTDDDDYNDDGDDGRADMAPATGNPATADDSPRRLLSNADFARTASL